MLMLELESRGSFQVQEAQNDENQCGIRGNRDYFYTATLECPASARDERGFVVDAMAIRGTVENLFRRVDTLPSCEDMACLAAEAIRDLCPDATTVRVSIGTEEVAYMTATLRVRNTAPFNIGPEWARRTRYTRA